MKLTQISTDKKNLLHLSNPTMEKVLERMACDDRRGSVEKLRQEMPFIVNYGMKYEPLKWMPRIYPAALLQCDANRNVTFSQTTGLVLLTMGNFDDTNLLEQAKRSASALPMTMAAFVGSSGRSLKILVATDMGGISDENEANQRYKAAYDYAAQLYDGVLPQPVSRVDPSVRDSFCQTVDGSPYYNSTVVPLSIVPLTVKTKKPAPEASVSSREKYTDYEYMFQRACEMVNEEMRSKKIGADNPLRHEAFLTELASRLRQLQMPEEEAVAHLFSHLWTWADEQHVRTIVHSAYSTVGRRSTVTDAQLKVHGNTNQMIRFLQQRYIFRYNTVMGYTEYRPNNSRTPFFAPLDDRVQKRMAIEARLAGLDVWDRDVARYVGSDLVTTYDPVWDYLAACHGQWDGHDHIRALARTVPTDNELWPQWFYTWFLGMVKQWRSTVYERYGNQVAPLLISKQGYNKTTFCRSLLPPELAWGYNDSLLLSEKKQVLQTMSQMLLINIDEFNQISPQLQQGFLKNIITLPSVKVKRPYGRHVEIFPRKASFIATTNLTDVLTDPTGSRRFLAVELTGPINVSHMPNHRQLFAQALAALDAGEPHWFDDAQTQQVIEYNRQFRQQSPVEQYFFECFKPARSENESGIIALTAAAIFERIRSLIGHELPVNSLRAFGRVLSAMPDLLRKRTQNGTVYFVKPLK